MKKWEEKLKPGRFEEKPLFFGPCTVFMSRCMQQDLLHVEVCEWVCRWKTCVVFVCVCMWCATGGSKLSRAGRQAAQQNPAESICFLMFLVFCCYGFLWMSGLWQVSLICRDFRKHHVALKMRFDANRFAFDQVGKNLEVCQESEEIIKQQAI